MNILLVNDDGYDAQGIKLLNKLLQKYGHVTVIAPKHPMSAMSVSINIRTGLSLLKEEKDIYSLSGSPADCVCFGLSMMAQKFDLVVSGCNHGYNLSSDTLYSGTVGACIEALLFKTKAVAFSCPMNFDLVERKFDRVMRFILERDLLSAEYLLNVNFPAGETVKGIKLTALAEREKNSYYEKREDGLYYAKRKFNHKIYYSDTDIGAVNDGFVSITPLTSTYFNSKLFDELRAKNKQESE